MTSSSSTPAPNQCNEVAEKRPEVEQVDLGLYTEGMAKLMKLMIGEISESTIKMIGEIFQNPEDAGDQIWKIFTDLPWIIGIFFVLVIIALCILIASVVVFFVRCFVKEKDGANPSTAKMIVTLVAIIICAGICAGGATAFLYSISNMRKGLSGIGDRLADTAADIGVFVDNYGKFMQCREGIEREKLNATIIDAQKKINAAAQKYEKKLNNSVESAELAQETLKNASVAMKAEHEKLVAALSAVAVLPVLPLGFRSSAPVVPPFPQKEIDQLKNLLKVVIKKLKSFQGRLKKANKDMQDKAKNVEDEINRGMKKLLEVVEKVKSTVKKIQDALKSVWTTVDDVAGNISIGLQVTIVIPLTLVCIMIFGFVILFLRFLYNWGRMKCCSEKAIRILGKTGAIILAIGGYSAMLIAVLVFLMAATCFLIAFASMFLCTGFFDDPDLLVFEVLPPNWVNIGYKEFTYSIHDALIKCKNDYPFFDALDGPRQMADKTLEQKYLDIESQDYSKEFREYDFDETQINTFKNFDTHPLLSNPVVGNMTEVLELKEVMKAFMSTIQDLTSRATRDELVDEIDTMVEYLTTAMRDHVAELISALLDLSPQCGGIMKVWDKAGSLVCNDISMPAQGSWMACIICGIGSFTVFHWMFKSTKYLKNFDKKKKESDEEADEKSKIVEKKGSKGKMDKNGNKGRKEMVKKGKKEEGIQKRTMTTESREEAVETKKSLDKMESLDKMGGQPQDKPIEPSPQPAVPLANMPPLAPTKSIEKMAQKTKETQQEETGDSKKEVKEQPSKEGLDVNKPAEGPSAEKEEQKEDASAKSNKSNKSNKGASDGSKKSKKGDEQSEAQKLSQKLQKSDMTQ